MGPRVVHPVAAAERVAVAASAAVDVSAASLDVSVARARGRNAGAWGSRERLLKVVIGVVIADGVPVNVGAQFAENSQ
jgi:hypothetical protein